MLWDARSPQVRRATLAAAPPATSPYLRRRPGTGEHESILFQMFERRVLTYNPANPPAFRVEMGNVGQHNYQWRYPPQ